MAAKKSPPVPTLAARVEIALPKPSLMSAELTPDGKNVLVAGFSGVYLVDATTGAETLRYRKAVGNVVWSAKTTADGTRVIAGNGGQKLQIWDARSAELLHELPTEGIVTRLSLSLDGKRAVTASGNNQLRLWDLEHGRALGGIHTKKSFVIAAAIAPVGTRAVHGGTDGVVRLVDCAAEKEIATAIGKGWIEVIDRSADGRFWISAGRDKTVMMWTASLEPVQTLRGFSRTIASVAISPDGSRVVAAGGGAPMLWDATDGKVLGKLAGEKVTAVSFSHDGASIVTWEYGTLRIHETPVSPGA